MRNLCLLCCAFCLFLSFTQCKRASFLLQNKEEIYIFVPSNATAVILHAADELDLFITKVVGVNCTRCVASLTEPNMIILSKSVNTDSKDWVMPSNKKPGEDGYYLNINADRVVIGGNNGRGVLYGVYTFLEKYLGCRWYSSDASFIPKYSMIDLPVVEEMYTPPVKWREVYYYDLYSSDIAARLKLNGNTLQTGLVAPNRYSITGGTHANWGLWCHSLYDLVSPELYATHQEYFSEIDGKRVSPNLREGNTQLCLTNPDLVDISVSSLRRLMAVSKTCMPIWSDSVSQYWSVSQMDGNGNCTCSKCLASDMYDGSPSGTMLKYVNQIAKAFPSKKIATLAYTYTRKAPLHTRPDSNVVIQMCAIETARAGINFPIATSGIHSSFRKDLEDWGKITKEVVVWDYVIQFQNLVSPFPNFYTLQDNINFYVKNNVAGIFCQGNREKGGEFAELRGYLLAKLLWNPKCDFEKEKDDFINGYYGKAGRYIKQYITEMEKALKESGLPLSMDGEPEAHRNGYLSEVCMERYKELFDKAENAVRDQPEFLKRVRKERMAIMYAQIRLEYGSIAERKGLLDEFIHLAENNNIWMLSEVDWREDQSGNREMFYNKTLKSLYEQ